MKKIVLAFAALAMLGACGHDKCDKSGHKTHCDNYTDEVVYAGTIPAADASGISYRLKLEDDGEFELVMRSPVAGPHDGRPSTEIEGHYELVNRQGEPSYYRLTAPGDTLYFVVSSDSTLTMVGKDLQPAPSGLDYTLNRVR